MTIPTGWLAGQMRWMRDYVRQVAIADFAAAVVAAVAAVAVRFGGHPNDRYLMLSLAMPLLWVIAVRVFGGYEKRFLGAGSDEFRRVLNAGLSLTGALAIISYAVNNELSRIYLLVSMQVIVALDLLVRFALRKRLHRRRMQGQCMSSVVAVGHEPAVRQLISELRREPHHGLQVVAACLAVRVNRDRGGRRAGGRRPRRRRQRGAQHQRGHGGGALLSGDGRHQAQGARLGTGEDGHRPVRRARAAGRGRPADNDPADRGADPAARGPPAAERAQAGGQGPVRPVRGRVRACGRSGR